MASKGGRPSAAKAARISADILAAAEHLFLSEGFAAARIEKIAALAGTSKQTVYARFAGKEALFIAVSDALLRDRFPAQVAPAGSLRETLMALASQILAAMLDPRMLRMYAIITAEAPRFPELARMTDEDTTFPGRVLMQNVLAAAAARGEIVCPDPRRAMLMLQNMILGAPLRAAVLGLEGGDSATAREWAHYAVDLFLDGARPREAPPLPPTTMRPA